MQKMSSRLTNGLALGLLFSQINGLAAPVPALTILRSPKSVRYDTYYTIETSPGLQGIYYQKHADGTCEPGDDSGTNGNCIKLQTDRLMQGPNYWLDTNPSWPGVYYKQDNGLCNYGGTATGVNCQIISFGKTIVADEIEPAEWGFADLHTHPAAHLAFGADDQGKNGIFFGQPGMRLEDDTLATDLAACSSDKHSGFDLDFAAHLTRQTIIGELNDMSGASHTNSGYPNFSSWPEARSGFHQQMHISWLRRAYNGGLRLMVASAVENITFSQVWNRGLIKEPSALQPDFSIEYQSAQKQLRFIRQLVAANSSWMQIVTSAAEAKDALRNNKLAVVLGLELDYLTADQIIELKRNFGVRLVTPIHTANNGFGGAAVYEDIFNTNNYFLNRAFFSIEGDPSLAFRLGIPARLPAAGLPIPKKIDNQEFCALGYGNSENVQCPGPTQGHKNILGLRSEDWIKRLMQEGLIVDLAHMSDKSQTSSVELAERFAYPMINSHSNIRADGETASSERDMRTSLAARLGRLGGMLGLGTGGETAAGIDGKHTALALLDTPIKGAPFVENKRVRMTGDQKTWSVAIAPYDLTGPSVACNSLNFTIQTGSDDLRGGQDRANAVVALDNQTLTLPLSTGEKWDNNSVHNASVNLPANTRLGDIRSISIVHAGTSNDSWTVNTLQASCEAQPGSAKVLARLSGAPLFKLTPEQKEIPVFARKQSGGRNAAVFKLSIKTGGDDLRGGNDNATAELEFRDLTVLSIPLNKGTNWGNGSVHATMIRLPDGRTWQDVRIMRIKTAFQGDNWNINGLLLEGFMDPMLNFGNTLNQALTVMNGRGVALGSDFNGFANQVPMSEQRVNYPFTLQESLQPSGRTVTLNRMVVGNRVFDVTNDGIAQIGMEPDFLFATAQASGEKTVKPVFKSAYDFVQMWSQIEAAAPAVR